MAQQQRKLWWKISTHGRVLGQGLKSECVDIFHQSFLRRCAILTSPNWAKQLSMATIPFCFEFFRCHVDVLQHYFSRSTISIAVFCLQNLICLLCTYQRNAGGGGRQGIGWGFDFFQKFSIKFPAHGQIIPVKCNQISPPRAAHCCQSKGRT